VPIGCHLQPGDPVKVRVRKKSFDGVVLSLSDQLEEDRGFEIRELDGPSDEFPAFDEHMLKLMNWAADYYQYPLGDVLRGLLPPDPAPRKRLVFRLSDIGTDWLAQGKSPRGSRQKVILEHVRLNPDSAFSGEDRAAANRLVEAHWLLKVELPDIAPLPPEPPVRANITLTEAQAKAVQSLCDGLDTNKFSCTLLQGVTGSGKTEVYLRVAEYALRQGKSVLVVVPEISLTPQLVTRFRARLGHNIAVLHSGVSDGERSRQWHLLNEGGYQICIGARSASFAPMKKLGLVIVDEEHDGALKQEDHLRYNARDLAVMRAKLAGCPVVLGSATPSLESYHNARTGRYKHVLLPERAGGQGMPKVSVIDRSKTDPTGSISPALKRAMHEAIDGGGQVMLLLNRRGYSSFLICSGCGFVPECPNCSVSLTNYRSASRLKCHYCGHSDAAPPDCPKCAAPGMFPGTLGTEALEEEVKSLFPSARVLRIDRESMERKGALERALGMIAAGEVEIIIGTQIIAKGHDFPNIALVGVVNADSAFHLPDFRASERSFQLFTQMAGRAGRGNRPGQVLLQTFNPRHPSIVFATEHDFRGFAEEELRQRHAFAYPPFSRLARIIVSAPNPGLAENTAERIGATLRKLAQSSANVEVVGPAPAALTKVINRYRWNLLLKSPSASTLHSLLRTTRETMQPTLDRQVFLQVDVDPVSLM
jgi:primosomal protein N' (replication factor Y)